MESSEGVADTWSGYIALTDLREENTRLKVELDQLRGTAKSGAPPGAKSSIEKTGGFKDENDSFEMVGLVIARTSHHTTGWLKLPWMWEGRSEFAMACRW